MGSYKLPSMWERVTFLVQATCTSLGGVEYYTYVTMEGKIIAIMYLSKNEVHFKIRTDSNDTWTVPSRQITGLV